MDLLTITTSIPDDALGVFIAQDLKIYVKFYEPI
jgi:hypothetical protein